MKKIISLFLIFFMSICLIGCKDKQDSSFGKVDYHFSGFYLEFYDDADYRLNYKNPCIYYQHKTETFKLESGNVPNMGFITYSNVSKNIVEQDGLTVFVLFGTIVLPYNAPDQVKIYVIKENKSGTNYVDTDMVDMIDLNEQGKYSVNYEYEFENTGYRFQFTLGYYKNGVN